MNRRGWDATTIIKVLFVASPRLPETVTLVLYCSALSSFVATHSSAIFVEWILLHGVVRNTIVVAYDLCLLTSVF